MNENDSLNILNDSLSTVIHTLSADATHVVNYEWVKHVLMFIGVIVLQYLLVRLTNYGYRKLKEKVDAVKGRYLKPIYIQKYEFLSSNRQEKVVFFLLNILRWVVIFIQLLITIPILFSIFPQTEHIAMEIFSYILNPLRKILLAIVNYIPNLFTIAIIYFIIHYIIKGLTYLSNEISKGKLKIKGFYPEWAKPTAGILRFLLYTFMVVMIFPYLPNSDSEAFKGISIFVGVLVSFGSSSAISNLISGIVITYMRPFQIGDRIRINDIVGNVIEKTAVVIRIRTFKNEIITIPNSAVTNTQTTNLSESARTTGLVVHLSVTLGYDTPWEQVHQLLIEAAQNTPDVLQTPQPFVLETAFNDFDITYEINAYINDADQLPRVLSGLRQNIQDKFRNAGISILSPHFIRLRQEQGQ